MSESQKIHVFSINDKLFLRENNEKVGYFKQIIQGFKLKYNNEVLKISEKTIGDRVLITIDNNSYLIRKYEITTWPDKKVKFHLKILNGTLRILDHDKKAISKIFSSSDIKSIEILKKVPNFNFILFLSLQSLLKE